MTFLEFVNKATSMFLTIEARIGMQYTISWYDNDLHFDGETTGPNDEEYPVVLFENDDDHPTVWDAIIDMYKQVIGWPEKGACTDRDGVKWHVIGSEGILIRHIASQHISNSSNTSVWHKQIQTVTSPLNLTNPPTISRWVKRDQPTH